ncbi:MAG: O-antigen ligase family protein [Candidatus Thiodiazotropha taylori]
MESLTKFLFSLWIVSLPFYSYSIFGSLSIDNLLVPIVIVSIVLRELTSSLIYKNRLIVILSLVFLFLVYSVSRLISVIDDVVYFNFTITLLGKQFIYLILPLLYVRTINDWIYTGKLIIFIAVIGIFSTLVASMGLFEFNVQRYAMSRFGIEGLQKSIGLLSNYGDMAILGSFSFLFMFVAKKNIKENLLGSLSKWSAAVLILGGYLGAQSRNMYLTLFVAGFMSLIIRQFTDHKAKHSLLVFLILLVSLSSIIFTLTIFEINPLESAKSIGGTKEATATVDARLGQYTFALKLFSINPLFGNGISVLEAGIEVHNIWLALLALCGLFGTVPILLIFIINLLSLINIRTSNEYYNQIKVIGLSQICCMLVAAEFYGAMTYIFLMMTGFIYSLSSLLRQAVRCSPTTEKNSKIIL